MHHCKYDFVHLYKLRDQPKWFSADGNLITSTYWLAPIFSHPGWDSVRASCVLHQGKAVVISLGLVSRNLLHVGQHNTNCASLNEMTWRLFTFTSSLISSLHFSSPLQVEMSSIIISCLCFLCRISCPSLTARFLWTLYRPWPIYCIYVSTAHIYTHVVPEITRRLMWGFSQRPENCECK